VVQRSNDLGGLLRRASSFRTDTEQHDPSRPHRKAIEQLSRLRQLLGACTADHRDQDGGVGVPHEQLGLSHGDQRGQIEQHVLKIELPEPLEKGPHDVVGQHRGRVARPRTAREDIEVLAYVLDVARLERRATISVRAT
jgi:hypothetical protein